MKKLMLMILFLILMATSVQAEAYQQLHQQIEQDLGSAEKVVTNSFFTPYKSEVDALKVCLEMVDTNIKNYSPKHYLQQLRRCEKKAKRFDGHYVMALRSAILKEDNTLFRVLIEANPRILQRDRWVDKSVKYYEAHRDESTFKAGEKLLVANEEEQRYRQMAAVELENYEANVKVLSYAQAKRSRTKDGKLRTFFVGYKKRNGVTVLIAENNNAYPVTLLVKLKNLKNYSVDRPSPYHVEVDPHTKMEIMHLRVKNKKALSSVRWRYSWLMGREAVQHDRSFIYALPFKRGSTVIVSQGFNGKETHTGKSKYAVDFMADEGTRVYAARGGKVIATESSFDKGGFDKSFGKYANYITIEHIDHTMGQYYHLKQDGVNVKVGQYVSKGQFIGRSGNTGYSSGPHLHFGVYKVDSDYRSLTTLPIRFSTNMGVIDVPKKGNVFKAVR